MHSINRKGVSEIVQIASIILLSLVALSLVWIYVSRVSGNSLDQLSPLVDCVQLQTKIESACLNSNSEIEVMINKDLTDEINEFYLKSESGYESFCGGTCSECNIPDSGIKKIFLQNSGIQQGDTIYLGLNACAQPLDYAIVGSCS